MDIVLADLKLQGRDRKVILHAPKNGFFYVIDRRDGKLLSAEKIGPVNWAERIDIATGRPVENPAVRFPEGKGELMPGGGGAHNWQAMSFSPRTGLAYIPKLEMPGYYSTRTIRTENWRARPYFSQTGYDPIPDAPATSRYVAKGSLLAWNPVTQSKAWEIPIPGLWNGGTLSTAGDLVFQGNSAGEFAAYHALSGEKLWSADAGLGIVGAPITYSLDGEQYVAVLTGWGGGFAAVFGIGVAKYGWLYGDQPRRLLVYKRGGKDRLPATQRSQPPVPRDMPELKLSASDVEAGADLFNSTCHNCHGWSAIAGGTAPDLRASPIALQIESFRALLMQGRGPQGMPKYDDLNDAEVRSLYAYIRQRARDDLAANGARDLPVGAVGP
jgi:quinohemoprotein ethanol dehydrogenase